MMMKQWSHRTARPNHTPSCRRRASPSDHHRVSQQYHSIDDASNEIGVRSMLCSMLVESKLQLTRPLPMLGQQVTLFCQEHLSQMSNELRNHSPYIYPTEKPSSPPTPANWRDLISRRKRGWRTLCLAYRIARLSPSRYSVMLYARSLTRVTNAKCYIEGNRYGRECTSLVLDYGYYL